MASEENTKMKKLLSTCALIGATLLAVLSGPAYADENVHLDRDRKSVV